MRKIEDRLEKMLEMKEQAYQEMNNDILLKRSIPNEISLIDSY